MFDVWKPLVCGIALVTLFFADCSYARGVSPYLPEKLNPILEKEVERLAVIAGIPNLTRPYSIATIVYYTDTIRESHPALYSRLTLAMEPYIKHFSKTHAQLRASYSEESHPLPNGRGNYSDALVSFSARSQWQIADWFAIYLGTHLTEYPSDALIDDNFEASGSTLSMGVDWAQLDIGYRDIWLSPFESTAQLLSTQGRNMPSVSLSNNLPIEFFNTRWNYHIFLAQMERQLVLFENELNDTDKPLLAGVHVSVQPVPWWSIGATRVFQFAGGERPRDFGTLWRAFIDPRGTDNDASVDEESGNQIASLVSRINFDGRLPFSFAVELAGEDVGNAEFGILGNTALTTGLFFPYFFSEHVALTYEYSNWQDAWYTNNVYDEGYTNRGFVLGNWAMQIQRDQNTASEGSSHYIALQWQTSFDHVLSVKGRLANHVDRGGVDYQQAWEVALDYTIPVKSNLVTFGTYAGEDALGESFSQVSLSFSW